MSFSHRWLADLLPLLTGKSININQQVMKSLYWLLWPFLTSRFRYTVEVGIMVGRDCLTPSPGKPNSRVSWAILTHILEPQGAVPPGSNPPCAWTHLKLGLVSYSLVWWDEWQTYAYVPTSVTLPKQSSASQINHNWFLYYIKIKEKYLMGLHTKFLYSDVNSTWWWYLVLGLRNDAAVLLASFSRQR